MRAAAIATLLVVIAAPAGVLADGLWAPRPPDRRPFVVGVRLGWNHATKYLDYGDPDPDDRDGTIGWVNGVNVGIAALAQASQLFGLQLEAAFSQKGARAASQRWRYTFIEVPVLLRVAPNWPVRPFGVLGPGFGFALDAEYCSPRPDPAAPECGERDPNSVERALIAGGGVEVAVPRGFAFADLRYWYGTTQAEGSGENAPNAYHRVLTLSVGYFY